MIIDVLPISSAQHPENEPFDAKSLFAEKGIRNVKKLLLINPPDADADVFDVSFANRRRYSNYPPYGLMILGTIAESLGVEVKILNLQHEILRRARAQVNHFNFSEELQKVIDSCFADFRPDLVGVTCMFTMTHVSFVDVCNRISKFEKPIAIGGVHVTNDLGRIQKDLPFIDFIFTREADENFKGFLKYLSGDHEAELGGFFIRASEEWKFVGRSEPPSESSIDIMPNYELLPDIWEYTEYGMVGSFYWFRGESTPSATVISNRGCRAQCTFCSVRNFNGVGVRQRSIECVVGEIEILHKRFGIHHIMFLDDDLFKDEARAISLFNELTLRQLDLTWDATNGVIAYSCTREVISAAAKSGCIGVNIGMESGNPRILKQVRKPGTIKNFLAAAENFRSEPSIVASVFLIIGFPGETFADISDTYNVSLEMDLDWYRIQHLQPLPNTPIYEEMVEAGLIDPKTQDGRFTVGSYGKAKSRDSVETIRDQSAITKLFDRSLEIPSKADLTDLWFFLDFNLNYKTIDALTDPVKLEQKRKMLERVSTVNSPNNAFAIYYLGELYRKLGLDFDLVDARFKEVVKNSEYWSLRCKQYELYR